MHKILAAVLTLSVSCALPNATTSGGQRQDSASIVNSGSTNAAGYRIELSSEGHARIAVPYINAFPVSRALVRRFFDDLRRARKSGAPGPPCMKSASFGTRTTVVWHEWTSPDLDCPRSGAMAQLQTDVNDIRASLNSGANRHRGQAGPINRPRIKTPLTPTPPEPTPYP